MTRHLTRRVRRPLLLLLALLAGCGGAVTPTAVSTTTSPLAPTLPHPTATATPDVATPEAVGRAFLSAWEAGDYATMYGLLTPELREGLDRASFTQAYRSPMDITTTISVALLPKTLGVDGDRAWIEFQEVWSTGIFGDLQASNQLDLVRVEGQWWVDWRRRSIWPDLAGGNSFGVEYQIPPRANIYDREGAGLAVPSTIVTVGVIPEQIEDEVTVLNALSQVLGMAPAEIQAIYIDQPAHWYVPIADITGDQSLAYDEVLDQPGIERRERPGRVYPLDGVAAHVVGWVSPIPAEAYDDYRHRGYRGDERVGISGLEAWGESTLAGRNGGRLYIVDADGAYVRSIAERRPERGRSIYTTLDRDLQYAAEQVLGDRRGAVVALDAATGAVLVMASGPHFNNNTFIRTTDEWTIQALVNDPRLPLLNRATQGLYPSGSIFKLVTAAAGLEAGNLSAQSDFYCPGHWDGLGSVNRKYCWLEEGHGAVMLKDAISASCNVTFYEVGKLLDDLDPTILPTYGQAFGFGQETGLPELREADGLVPDPAWKKETYREGWGTGDAVNLAIGQGYLLVTPLQVARMVAAIANGGTLYRPYLVAQVETDAATPQTVTTPLAQERLPISEAHLEVLHTAMLGTTTASVGTASHRFAGLDVPVAGKTGTAEPADEDALPHSWFAGYFPTSAAEDAPRIAMVVMVENAGEGSTVAAPMFRQIVEAYYGLPLTPLPDPPEPAQGD
jgi:penicillin-binding protein 2